MFFIYTLVNEIKNDATIITIIKFTKNGCMIEDNHRKINVIIIIPIHAAAITPNISAALNTQSLRKFIFSFP
jgi:hypothetical protein